MSLPVPFPLPSDDASHATATPRVDHPRAALSCPSASLAVLEFVGEHDLGQYEAISEILRLAATRRRNVLVDFSQCAFVDSTVVGLLLAAQDEVTSDGGRFTLVLPLQPNPLARIAEVMGLAEMFETHASLEEALASVEHVTRVRDLRARFGNPDTFAAECSCGWRGVARTGIMAMRTAHNDARNHADARGARARTGGTAGR